MAEENKHKHLEFIQLTITRMAANSFLLRGWCMTLVAALLALAAKDARADFLWIAFFPAFGFWWLDAYFLRQERLYRALYEDVIELDDSKINYSMDVRPYEANRPGKPKVKNWPLTCLAPTVASFYLSVLATLAVISWLTQ